MRLIVIFTALLLLCIVCVIMFLLLSPSEKKPDKEVEIHVKSGSEIKIVSSSGGISFNILYETTEEKQEDFDPLPDITSDDMADYEDPTAPGREFWLQVAAFETLDVTEREAVAGKLADMGFISRESVSSWVYDGVPNNTVEEPAPPAYSASDEEDRKPEQKQEQEHESESAPEFPSDADQPEEPDFGDGDDGADSDDDADPDSSQEDGDKDTSDDKFAVFTF